MVVRGWKVDMDLLLTSGLGTQLEHPLCHGDIGHTCTSEESLPFQEGC